MDTLSSYLAEQIASLDEELTAKELAEYAANRDALLGSVEQAHTEPTMVSIYTFLRKATSGVSAEVVKAVGDSAAWHLDDCLSRLMVSEIPQMVSRALQLEPMSMHQDHQIDEDPYLRESTRCYLFGLFNASVALSRSALAQALCKKIPTLLQGKSNEERLKILIKMARSSVLKQSTDICDLTDEVRRTANGIIHGKMCQQLAALRVLGDTRQILQTLYGSVD